MKPQYVYIVLNHYTEEKMYVEYDDDRSPKNCRWDEEQECRIEGVYWTRAEAEKRAQRINNPTSFYVSVLKQKVKGIKYLTLLEVMRGLRD